VYPLDVTTLGRHFWFSVLALGYVCMEAARAGGGASPWVAMALLPLLLAEAFRRADRAAAAGIVAREGLLSVRAVATGAALLVAARSGGATRPALDAAANLGAALAATGALVALARIPGPPGILAPPRAARALDAALFAGFVWGIATAVPGAYVVVPAPSLRFDPSIIEYATASAGAGTLLVLVAATLRLRTLRRLELGVGDRARAAFALSLAAFTLAVPAALLGIGRPDRVLPAACVAASAGAAWTAVVADATLVTRVLRGLVAVAIPGAPLFLVCGAVAEHAPQYASFAVGGGVAGAILIGLLGHVLARPLGPEQSRWLSAIEDATHEALKPEPRAALCAALAALARIDPSPGARPEIWQREPGEVLSVDVAGYLAVDRDVAPERLYEAALHEPERTLRTDVLRALEVRRADLREVLAWLDARDAFSATLVLDEDEPIGFVLLRQVDRRTPLTLEEARALSALADRLSSVLSVTAALGRARARELEAARRAEAAEAECRRLAAVVGNDTGKLRALVEKLAAPARRAAYSAAARGALERVESLAARGEGAALVVPPGSDALAWAAHLHVQSPRASGALVIADVLAGPDVHAGLADEEAPLLRLADDGTLVVLAVTALPRETQERFAISLARREAREPGRKVFSPAVVLVVPEPLATCVARGRLAANVARWFVDTEVVLPALRDRPEDLRALALDTLARKSVELGRELLGIEPSALRMVIEHPWPHNELELESVLGRAAALAQGSAVTAGDLERAGFVLIEEPLAEPLPARRRRAAARR